MGIAQTREADEELRLSPYLDRPVETSVVIFVADVSTAKKLSRTLMSGAAFGSAAEMNALKSAQVSAEKTAVEIEPRARACSGDGPSDLHTLKND